MNFIKVLLKIGSTYNEGKSVVAERFLRTLKNNIYKYMTTVSKNVYFDVLNDIVDRYNNIYLRTIKMKPTDVKSNSYAECNADSNEKDPKFNVGDHVRISIYTNIFAKEHTPNWSEEDFVIEKVKNTVPWTNVINGLNVEKIIGTFHEKELQKINDLNREEFIGTFYEKELQKTNRKEFKIEKVIKRKRNKLYIKWKGYDNSFNSWIDKKKL